MSSGYHNMINSPVYWVKDIEDPNYHKKFCANCGVFPPVKNFHCKGNHKLVPVSKDYFDDTENLLVCERCDDAWTEFVDCPGLQYDQSFDHHDVSTELSQFDSLTSANDRRLVAMGQSLSASRELHSVSSSQSANLRNVANLYKLEVDPSKGQERFKASSQISQSGRSKDGVPEQKKKEQTHGSSHVSASSPVFDARPSPMLLLSQQTKQSMVSKHTTGSINLHPTTGLDHNDPIKGRGTASLWNLMFLPLEVEMKPKNIGPIGTAMVAWLVHTGFMVKNVSITKDTLVDDIRSAYPKASLRESLTFEIGNAQKVDGSQQTLITYYETIGGVKYDYNNVNLARKNLLSKPLSHMIKWTKSMGHQIVIRVR